MINPIILKLIMPFLMPLLKKSWENRPNIRPKDTSKEDKIAVINGEYPYKKLLNSLKF